MAQTRKYINHMSSYIAYEQNVFKRAIQSGNIMQSRTDLADFK